MAKLLSFVNFAIAVIAAATAADHFSTSSSPIISFAEAASYCSNYVDASSCVGRDQTAGCTWIDGAGLCVGPCAAAGYNQTRCSELSPACEYVEQRCRSVDSCVAVGVDKCPTTSYCQLVYPSGSSNTVYCSVNCTVFRNNGNACSSVFGSFCEYNSTRQSCTRKAGVPPPAATTTTTTAKAVTTTTAKAATSTTTTAAYGPCSNYTTEGACRENANQCVWVPPTSTISGAGTGCVLASSTTTVAATTTSRAIEPTATYTSRLTEPIRTTEEPVHTTTAAATTTVFSCSSVKNEKDCRAYGCTWGTSSFSGDVMVCATPSAATSSTTAATEPIATTTAAPTTTAEFTRRGDTPLTDAIETTRPTDATEHTETSRLTEPIRTTEEPVHTTNAATTTVFSCSSLQNEKDCLANKCAWTSNAGTTTMICVAPHNPPTEPDYTGDVGTVTTVTRETIAPYTTRAAQTTQATRQTTSAPAQPTQTKPPTQTTDVPRTTTRAPDGGRTTTTAVTRQTTTAGPTRIPNCNPSSAPVISINITADVTLSLASFNSFFAAVEGPYYACNYDVASLVAVRWSVARATYPDQAIPLPSSAVVSGRLLTLPPFVVTETTVVILRATAIYKDFVSVATKRVMFVSPKPVVAIAGASVTTVSVGSGFFLAANVLIPCNSESLSRGECDTATGLRPYVCRMASATAGCGPFFSWSCATSNGGSCGDSVRKALALNQTYYGNVSLTAVGEYRFTAKYTDAQGNTASAYTTVVVAAGVKPPVTIACVGGTFSSDATTCTAITGRELTVTWTVDGYRSSTVGPYIAFENAPSTIVATVTDKQGNTNQATYTQTPIPSSLVCTKNVDVATGLSTAVTVSCRFTVSSSTTAAFAVTRTSPLTIMYGYRRPGTTNETVISPVPQVLTLAASTADYTAAAATAFTFTAPPVNVNIQVVATVLYQGRVVGRAVLSSLRVTYTVSSSDITNLQNQITDGKSVNDTAAIVNAVGTLSTVSQATGTTRAQRADISTAIVNAVFDIVPSSSSDSTLSDSTVLIAAAAVANAVTTSLNATRGSSAETLSSAAREKAAAALAQLSSVAATKGDDATRDSLLSAASALGDSNKTQAIIANVAVAVLMSAPADGSVTPSIGTGAVKVAAAQFVSTDAAGRAVSVTVGAASSSATLPQSFAIPSADPTVNAGITVSTSDASTSTAAKPAGASFASSITRFSVYLGGQEVAVSGYDQDPIEVRLSVSSTAGKTIVIRYLDEATQQWKTTGVTTKPCSDNSATHVCGETTHFTAFAAFSTDGDSSTSTTGMIVGIVIGVAAVVAIVVVVVAKMRSSSARRKEVGQEGDYNLDGQVVPLSEMHDRLDAV